MVKKSLKRDEPDTDLCFTGEPISAAEARTRWPIRYSNSATKLDSTDYPSTRGSPRTLKAKTHYNQAFVDGVLLKLGDDVYVQGEANEPNNIAKIIELFEGIDGDPYFRAQWFYRPENTVIEAVTSYEKGKHVQAKRVFLSNVEDDNSLNCIHSKVEIAKFPLKMVSENQDRVIPLSCDFFYDMTYEINHHTFSSVDDDIDKVESEESTLSSEIDLKSGSSEKKELYLLDLYAGCGAMSTGLTMGASLSGVKLKTKWAVDFNEAACRSFKHNHPNTEVINEAAGDFLELLKHWRKLCQKFGLIPTTEPIESDSDSEDDNPDDVEGESNGSADEFEVGELLSICYGNPKDLKKTPSALHFKVRWKGYDSEDDTWEPYDGIRDCKDKLKEFVTRGFTSKLLPLPGDVHLVCGGPPCQGVSGFNRYREEKDPLADEKNFQLVIYMNIIDFLQPKYVLMENVVDLVKFSQGFLARYAIARLVNNNYQTRLGIMAAGSYGVPQCRFRVFLWASQATTKLPPFPLPTHEAEATTTYPIPNKFEFSKVRYNAESLVKLEPVLTLEDAIKDLPTVTNDELADEREYETSPKKDFQKFIRLKRADTLISVNGGDNSQPHLLYNHLPLRLNDDDFERVSKIPYKKGANFRDLGGVIIDKDNVVNLDPSVKRAKVKSGKFLIPKYALTFEGGKSTKPFGRLFWDEIVSTVVARAQPHNRCILHPSVDRVLTVRENARIQGFPDFYRLHGKIKEKYTQVGNAVAVPVGVALGYALGMTSQGLCDDKHVIKLPFKYPQCLQKKEDSATLVEETS